MVSVSIPPPTPSFSTTQGPRVTGTYYEAPALTQIQARNLFSLGAPPSSPSALTPHPWARLVMWGGDVGRLEKPVLWGPVPGCLC